MRRKIEVKYDSLKFTALTIEGSVVGHVLPKVIFFSAWSLIIVVINRYGTPIKINDFLITLMVLVLSLLLVFRTNTAYDRYWEGRRLWSTMTMTIRSMSRNIWVHITESKSSDRFAKEKAINLLMAYPVAVKRYLRGEYGTHYDDLSTLVEHIPCYCTPSSIQPMVQDLPQRINHPNEPISLAVYPPAEKGQDPTNLPLEIAYCLATYCAEVIDKEKIPNPINSALLANVNSLIDCLSGFERILRTPLPVAYSVHLNQCLWLFCLSLPFQLLTKFTTVRGLDWAIIPILAAVSFTAFGIVNIGEEIENPFGYDANDLPLDEYCDILKQELQGIILRPPPNLQNWTAFLKETTRTFNSGSESTAPLLGPEIVVEAPTPEPSS